jgi:hypothetical protein
MAGRLRDRDQIGVDVGQGRMTVDLGLAIAEEVQVRPMQDKNLGHARPSGKKGG